MARTLRFGVLLLVVLLNLTPAFAIYNDCSQYLLVTVVDARGIPQCGFCTFTGGWENQDGSLSCNYSCSWQMCRTA
jgi:hypothetical protein